MERERTVKRKRTSLSLCSTKFRRLASGKTPSHTLPSSLIRCRNDVCDRKKRKIEEIESELVSPPKKRKTLTVRRSIISARKRVSPPFPEVSRDGKSIYTFPTLMAENLDPKATIVWSSKDFASPPLPSWNPQCNSLLHHFSSSPRPDGFCSAKRISGSSPGKWCRFGQSFLFLPFPKLAFESTLAWPDTNPFPVEEKIWFLPPPKPPPPIDFPWIGNLTGFLQKDTRVFAQTSQQSRCSCHFGYSPTCKYLFPNPASLDRVCFCRTHLGGLVVSAQFTARKMYRREWFSDNFGHQGRWNGFYHVWFWQNKGRNPQFRKTASPTPSHNRIDTWPFPYRAYLTIISSLQSAILSSQPNSLSKLPPGMFEFQLTLRHLPLRAVLGKKRGTELFTRWILPLCGEETSNSSSDLFNQNTKNLSSKERPFCLKEDVSQITLRGAGECPDRPRVECMKNPTVQSSSGEGKGSETAQVVNPKTNLGPFSLRVGSPGFARNDKEEFQSSGRKNLNPTEEFSSPKGNQSRLTNPIQAGKFFLPQHGNQTSYLLQKTIEVDSLSLDSYTDQTVVTPLVTAFTSDSTGLLGKNPSFRIHVEDDWFEEECVEETQISLAGTSSGISEVWESSQNWKKTGKWTVRTSLTSGMCSKKQESFSEKEMSEETFAKEEYMEIAFGTNDHLYESFLDYINSQIKLTRMTIVFFLQGANSYQGKHHILPRMNPRSFGGSSDPYWISFKGGKGWLHITLRAKGNRKDLMSGRKVKVKNEKEEERVANQGKPNKVERSGNQKIYTPTGSHQSHSPGPVMIQTRVKT